MEDNNFTLTLNKLCLLVMYKETKEDIAIPSGKAALLTWWNKTKHHLSLRCCSPNNSKVKEEEESVVLEETAGLVIGDYDSEDNWNEK